MRDCDWKDNMIDCAIYTGSGCVSGPVAAAVCIPVTAAAGPVAGTIIGLVAGTVVGGGVTCVGFFAKRKCCPPAVPAGYVPLAGGPVLPIVVPALAPEDQKMSC